MQIPVIGPNIKDVDVSLKRKLLAEVRERLPKHVDPIMGKELSGSCGIHILDQPDCSFVVMWKHGKLTTEGYRDNADANISGSLDQILVGALSPSQENVMQVAFPEISGNIELRVGTLVHLSFLPDVIADQLDKLDRTKDLQQVPILEAPSAEDIAEHVNEKTPFLMPQATWNWPLTQETPESFLRKFGQVTMGPNTFTEYEQQAKTYSGAQSCPPALLPSLSELPPFPDGFVDSHQEAFYSGPGTLTPLHRDLINGVGCVFLGERTFWLFPPKQSRFLYPYRHPIGDFQKAHVTDPSVAQPAHFAAYQKAAPLKVGVKPGDILFVPAAWWHAVFTEAPSLIIKFTYPLNRSWDLTGAPSMGAV